MMRFLQLLVGFSLLLALVNAAPAQPDLAPESSSPPISDDSNSTSILTTETIESTWVLYTGSALNGFKNVVFTKPSSDPSRICNLKGYYDPSARNATTAVDCFLDLQAMIVYAYQQGLKIYYSGTMYLAGPDGLDDDCAVICISSSDSFAPAPLRESSWSWIIAASTALVLRIFL